jgi:hypothetical protein
MSFYPPRSSKIRAGELEGWVADETNEHGATLLMDARDAGPRTRLDMRIFACFPMAGVVPPLSLFLRAILEEYGLLLSQLHPNSSWLCQSFSTSARPSWGFTHRSRSSATTTT